MANSFVKRRLATLITSAAIATTIVATPYIQAYQSDLPEIGTASVQYLSLEKERRYGDAYMRQIRASMPLVHDPLITEYVTSLGQNLLLHSDSVNFPFTFFVVNNPELNAFAFFGGHIGIHTGLFYYADTESELASVFAHEIAHVTQRHLARKIEAQSKSTPATIAAAIGSIMLAIISPQAGMAGLTGSMAAAQQLSLNYSREHEAEADRVGMRTMVDAGYDPYAMPSFFGKMAAKFRYSSKPPEMLLTHPLPESRISDSRNRANQYPKRFIPDGLAYQLTKARIMVRFGLDSIEVTSAAFKRHLEKSNRVFPEAAYYGYALSLLELNQLDEAKQIIDKLLANDPENLYYVDTATDIDVAAGRLEQAAERLRRFDSFMRNNAVITMNLASVLNKQKKYQESIRVLERFRRENPDYFLTYSILGEAYAGSSQPAQQHITRAEQLALMGGFKEAIRELRKAYPMLRDNLIEQSRIEARIRQLKESQVQLEQLSS